MVGANRSLTAVRGLAVGHADDASAATGCTAVLGPFRAAVEVRGRATGSRELDVLSPLHVVSRVDAILLTGGSAFGLAAADGVSGWLEERGRGFRTRAARVPIVPAAVLYDLGVGRPDVRPGPSMGREAAAAAGPGPVEEGRRGAGAGATVGKLRGMEHCDPAGIGSWADSFRGAAVGALAVVNAFGDVLDAEGGILAGCRDDGGGHLDTARALREGRAPPGWDGSGAGESTTLGVVATDRPLCRVDLKLLAGQATNALARRISPFGTVFDGDIVFAVSPGAGALDGSGGSGDPDRLAPGEMAALGAAAGHVLERAVERAVRAAAEGGA